MNDEEREKFWAEMREKNVEPPSQPMTEEELAAYQRQSEKWTELDQEFPGRDVTETATLEENGEIFVVIGVSAGGISSIGNHTYTPDHRNYAAVWDRHKLSEKKGRHHTIAMKIDKDSETLIDMGDCWSD